MISPSPDRVETAQPETRVTGEMRHLTGTQLRWRRFWIALSFVNLCYARIWSEILTYTRGDTFAMEHAPARAVYLAAMANVVLLAGSIWLIYDRLDRTRLSRLADRCIPALMLLPAEAVRSLLATRYPYLRGQIFTLISPKQLLLLAAVGVLALVYLSWRFERQLFRWAARLLVIFSPLVVLTFGQALYCAAQRRDATLDNHALAVPAASTAGQPRVLWLIFDEWDYRLTFIERRPGLQLPEIDRFRSESLAAENAYPPSIATITSVPALLTGRFFTRHAEPLDDDKLRLTFSGTGGTALLGNIPDIFSSARQAGFNTAVAGWYLPYCRVFNTSLSACSWHELANQFNTLGSSFGTALLHENRSLFETRSYSPFGESLSARKHAQSYRELRQEAISLACKPSLGLVFVHFNIPHPPYIYDPASGAINGQNRSPDAYANNLALLDRTILDLRENMEKAGTWANTTILLSSDHWFRGANHGRRVPFLLKLAGMREGVRYTQPFNTVISRDLLLAVLHSQVRDPQSAVTWLDRHRGDPGVAPTASIPAASE